MVYFKRKVTIVPFILLVITLLFSGCGKFGASAKVDKQLELAVKYLSENKFDEAVLAYNDLIKIDSKNLSAYKGLGRAYELQGKYTEAEKTLQDGLSKVEDKNQIKLCLAGLYVGQGKNDLAEKTYSELLEADKSLISAYEGLAQILINQGRADEAVKIANQCIQSNSASEKSYNLLAGAYISKGDQNQVLSLLSQSLKINPNQQAAYLLLEQLYNRDWVKVAEFGSTLVSSDETAGRMLKIYAYNKAEQYNKSVDEYLALNDKSTRADKARVITAISYVKTGDKKSAEKLIGEINLKNTKNPFLYADVARYYLEAGDFKQARKIALEGSSLDDTCIENYLVLVEVANKGNQAEALYYSYLLLTRSFESAVTIEKDLKRQGFEVKFPGIKNVTIDSSASNNSALTQKSNNAPDIHDKQKVVQYIIFNNLKDNSTVEDFFKYICEDIKYMDLTGDGLDEALFIPRGWNQWYVIQSVNDAYRCILETDGGKYGNEVSSEQQFLKLIRSSGGTGAVIKYMQIYKFNGIEMKPVSENVTLNSRTFNMNSIKVREELSEISGPITNFEYALTKKTFDNSTGTQKSVEIQRQSFTWNSGLFKFDVTNL